MSIEKLESKPNNPLLTIQVKKGTPISDIKRTILNMMNEELNNLAPSISFDFDELEITFDPPCRCNKITMKYTELPLEDLSCKCEKTKLITYNFI